MLGIELAHSAWRHFSTRRVYALSRSDLDITDAAAVDDVIGRLAPCLVINAAACTDVDGCETQRDTAWSVNAEGPGHLAAACRSHGCRLVHVSTDFVFDGRKRSPYFPDDPVNPLSVYGATKAEGERRVRAALADHVIVRTSWLFAARGKNFVRTMLRLASHRDELHVVDDQVGCPTYAPDLADALVRIAASGCIGTYHFRNGGSCSWHEFASEIMRQSGRSIPVHAIASAQMKRAAVRPAYSVLDLRSMTHEVEIAPRTWEEGLTDCLDRLPLSHHSPQDVHASATVSI
jgi:dTDP-4-dehydrorhamnose reductase